MKTKFREREQARVMRKRGDSIPHIAHVLGVSKSSVSLWLKDTTLPAKALRILENKRKRSRILATAAKRKITSDRLILAAYEAHAEMSAIKLTRHTALLACSLMYWCEGSKSKNDSEFTFTNADPMTIRGFISLFRKAFAIDEKRLRVKMHLHTYHNEKRQKEYWSNVTGIPFNQFQNTYWKTNSGKSIKQGYPGCVHIRYHDVEISRKISAVARNFLMSSNVLK